MMIEFSRLAGVLTGRSFPRPVSGFPLASFCKGNNGIPKI
jgi:hypothetical protein